MVCTCDETMLKLYLYCLPTTSSPVRTCSCVKGLVPQTKLHPVVRSTTKFNLYRAMDPGKDCQQHSHAECFLNLMASHKMIVRCQADKLLDYTGPVSCVEHV